MEKNVNSTSTKDQYSIIGGLLGDKDKRTRHGLRIMLATFLGVLFLLTGLGSYIYQLGNYNYYLVNNTTPIGSSLEFARSGAEITISDVWTDQNRDVTVVKLGYSQNARKLLSTQGKNYNLYMATKEKDRPKKLEMSYGMLSTDGDAFLFLKGKLDERAYQVFIANQVSLISGDDTADDDTKVNVNEADSVTKALSQYSMNDVNNEGVISFGKKAKPVNTPDNINFRINPYS
ncbi:flagellar biosynthesis protein FliS, partial [Enterococcus faecium]|nr:flagellar biosynthesis protein FliS [Enterococcus faecium]